MFIRRMFGLILAIVLFCATASLGSFCELYCNAASHSQSHSDMRGHRRFMHHDMANCQDCTNQGVRFVMNDSSCHHIDQAQLLDKSPYRLVLSSSNSHAVRLYTVSKSESRGSCGILGFSNPLALRQSSISRPPVVSLRI